MFNRITDPYFISGAIGAICSAILLVYIGKKKPHLKSNLSLGFISAIAGMLVGAHLLFFITGLPSFGEKYGSYIISVQTLLDAVLDASSGMVFYGGLYGAIIGVMIFCRIRHLNSRTYLNVAACAYPLLHAFGRIGCAIGGCCYGIEYHGFMAIQYTAANINPGISDHIADFPRFPVQPLEAIAEFILCFILTRMLLKTDNKYSLLAIYLFSYGIIRFLDEFLRGDEVRGLWGPFSTSQWIALISIIGVVIYYITSKKRSAYHTV